MDVTSLVIEAQDARSRMQEAKSRIKYEVRRKYEAQMKREVEDASQDAEIEFARTLARVNDAGVPQHILRSEVLRTNVWSRWTYWRDLAGIEPDRVTAGRAQKARNTYWEWSDSFRTMTVFATPNGPLSEHVVYTVTPETLTHEITGKLRIPSIVNDEWAEARAWKLWGNRATYTDAIMAEIQARIDAGDVTWK